jgi:hypothetical protein
LDYGGIKLEDQSGPAPSWVSAYLNFRHVAKIQARLSGPRPEVPEEIDGYKLSHPAREILCWWLSVRGDKLLPTADDVNLRNIVELSPYLRYMSWEGDESLVIRVFGSALCEAAGMDLRGVDIFAHREHEHRNRDIARLKILPNHPCGAIAFWNIVDQTGVSHLLELMTLPIGPGSDGKDRIIGTVMPINFPADMGETWDKTMDMKNLLEFHDALYVDVGHGVP